MGREGGAPPHPAGKAPVNQHRPSVVSAWRARPAWAGQCQEASWRGHLARLPRTSWAVEEGPADPGRCPGSPGPKPRPQGGRGQVEEDRPRGGAEAADWSGSAPVGLGLHLRPQLLPLRPGHVLHPAAAQGQQEGWKRGAPRQAGLLHPLLCLHLTGRPGSEPHSAPSPACRGRLSCLTRRNVPPRSLRPLQGFGKHRPGAS